MDVIRRPKNADVNVSPIIANGESGMESSFNFLVGHREIRFTSRLKGLQGICLGQLWLFKPHETNLISIFKAAHYSF